MSWSRSAFSRHYRKVTAEGPDPRRLLEKCLMDRLHVRNIKYLSDTEIMLDVSKKDFQRLVNLAGNRYRIKVVREGGYFYKAGFLKRKKAMIAGFIVFSVFMFYQNLFITEIEVSGYESISEQRLRETMREAGFYEGCRKNIDIDKVKLYMFEEHDNISWIGVKYKGSLAQVSIAETDALYEKNKVADTSPCNIVADNKGYVNFIDPEEGIRAVEDGAYVKEGDVLISGKIPLQKTTYEEGSESEQFSYVHAKGTVEVKSPVRVNFYCPRHELKKEKTGRKSINFSVNDFEVMRGMCPFEVSSVRRISIIDLVRPVKLKIQVNLCEEIKIKRVENNESQVKKQVINEIHKFVEEKLPDNTQILNKSLNFTTEKNIINIGVTLETLQQIGKEEEIIVDKSNGKTEKNDNQ